MHIIEELEKKYSKVPVRFVDGSNTGHGVLSLAGKNTSLTLNTSEYLGGDDAGNGWFNLVLQQNDGSSILLLNALTTASGMCSGERREWEFDVFPNIVVLDAEPLLPEGNVREITFSLEGLNDVFCYEIAERQSLYRANPDVKKLLRGLRDIERPYPRRYAYFKPDDVFLIHRLPRVLRERVADRLYEIFVDHVQRRRHHTLTIEPVVHATIRFDAAVTLTHALDEVWSWRRFFQQLAMRPLAINVVRCRFQTGRRDRWSYVYLPNLDRERVADDFGICPFGPHNVPYGEWRDRGKFAAAMRTWLEKDERRRLFRVRLDRVLEQMEEISSPKLVADLCSAIETLEELRAPSELKDSDLSLMIDAAAHEGAKISPPVPRDRIEGLLGLLRHQSLSQRLKALSAALETDVPKDLARQVIQHARELRTFEAHGGAWDEMRAPLVAPTLDMLAAMCVLWDLTTSGLPVSQGERRLNALIRIYLASAELANGMRRKS